MSGPVPDTAEFLMRSNCTSQPTSLTSTFTPVCCSNGCRIFCVSSTGCGPLFMTHIVTVAPLMLLAGAAALVVSELLLLPPQAATTSASTMLAASNMKRRVLLALLMLLPPPLENVYGLKRWGLASRESSWQHLLRAVKALFPKRRLTRHQGHGQGEMCVGVLAVLDTAQQGLRGKRAEIRLLLTDGGQRRVSQRGHLDVIEADDRDVLGHAEAGGLDRAHRAHGHHVGCGEHRGGRLVDRQQPCHGLAPAVVVVVAVDHELVEIAQTQALHGALEGAQALHSRSRLERARNVRNPLVA